MTDCTEFTFEHADFILAGYHWPTVETSRQDPPRSLVIVHGLGEYARRYDRTVSHFVDQGYEVFAYDLEGHGRSAGKRGHIRSWPLLVSAINSFLGEVQNRQASRLQPISIWGHSLGGLITLSYLTDRPEAVNLSCAVVTSPALGLSFEPSPVLTKAANLLERVTPSVTKSNELNVNSLSRDAGVVSNYMVDPQVHDRISIRLGNQLLKQGKRLLAQGYHGSTPLLVMHGTEDGITNPAASANYAEQSTGPISLKLWDDCYHELHHEPEKTQVLSYMSNWLNTHNPTQ